MLRRSAQDSKRVLGSASPCRSEEVQESLFSQGETAGFSLVSGQHENGIRYIHEWLYSMRTLCRVNLGALFRLWVIDPDDVSDQRAS